MATVLDRAVGEQKQTLYWTVRLLASKLIRTQLRMGSAMQSIDHGQ